MWEEFITFFTIITTGWMMIHTILLGFVFLYWIIVIAGMTDIDMLSDIDVDADGFDAGDAGSSVSGILSSFVGLISMNNIPITISCSIIITIMWVIGCFAYHFAGLLIQNTILLNAVSFIIFITAFWGSCHATFAITYPFRNLFKTHTGVSNSDIIGQSCIVKTSKVTETFGEAELTIDNSYLQISIRSKEEGLTKGDEVVIYDYDSEKNTYSVGKY